MQLPQSKRFVSLYFLVTKEIKVIIINLILKVDVVCINLLLLFSSLVVLHTCVVFGTLNTNL